MHGKNHRNSIEAYLYQIFEHISHRIAKNKSNYFPIKDFIAFTCVPITAKMNIIITRTNVKFPRAPIVFPIIDIKRFNVGQDFANLNTRN